MNRSLTFIALIAFLSPAPVVLAQQKMDDMPSMGMSKQPTSASSKTYSTTGIVKKLDATAGVVTLSHEPVKGLNWPAMTMGFKVADKASFSQFVEGKKVAVEFKQVDKDYVITAVK